MHPSRIVLVTAAAIAAASMLFDFVTTDLGGDVIGWDAGAWPAVVLVAATAIAATAGDRREGLPAPGTLLTVVLTAAATVFAIAKVVDAAAAARLIRDASGEASIGAGTWILLVAAVAGLGGAIATSSRRVG